MEKRIMRLVVFVCLMTGAFSSLIMAEDQASYPDESVRKFGVAWNIAQDRKIENIAGVYQPESLDKYMQRYFEQLSVKVDRLIEQNSRLEKKVDELLVKSSQALGSSQQKKI